MSSSKEYLEFVLNQLADFDGIQHRAMMGEYILYYNGKIWGGIYDDRLLVKNIPVARKMMPCAEIELPYEGGSPMILVDNVDDRDFLKNLITEMYSHLPAPKSKK